MQGEGLIAVGLMIVLPLIVGIFMDRTSPSWPQTFKFYLHIILALVCFGYLFKTLIDRFSALGEKSMRGLSLKDTDELFAFKDMQRKMRSTSGVIRREGVEEFLTHPHPPGKKLGTINAMFRNTADPYPADVKILLIHWLPNVGPECLPLLIQVVEHDDRINQAVKQALEGFGREAVKWIIEGLAATPYEPDPGWIEQRNEFLISLLAGFGPGIQPILEKATRHRNPQIREWIYRARKNMGLED